MNFGDFGDRVGDQNDVLGLGQIGGGAGINRCG